MYRLRETRQSEYEPVTADIVRQWVAEGKISSQTEVQQEGSSEWKPITDFPEFRDALAAHEAAARPSSSLPPGGQKRQGLAIASLVLGIVSLIAMPLSFGLGFLVGIPAVITGHLARYRSRKSPAIHGGGGMALAGLITGYIAAVVSLLLVVEVKQLRTRAENLRCFNNIKLITLAAQMWARDHDGKFPPDFIGVATELNSPGLLVCPIDKGKVPAKSWTAFGTQNVSYLYLTPGAPQAEVLRKAVFQCPRHRHIGYGDGDVEWGRSKERPSRRD